MAFPKDEGQNPFWREFKNKYFEKKPLALSGASNGNLIVFTPDQVFELMLNYTEMVRANDQIVAKCRAVVDGGLVTSGKALLPFLPVRDDRSFEGYHRRLVSGSKGIQYGIIINHIHAMDSSFFESVCRQLLPFVREVGIPLGYRSTTIWIGNYEKTPFGIHQDLGLSGFQVPIVGTKRIRTWNSNYGRKHPDLARSLKYKKHMRDSVLLEAGPGRLLYWPSDCWHIGETGGQFHVAMGIPYYLSDCFGPARQVINSLTNPPNAFGGLVLDRDKGENASFPLKGSSLESNAKNFFGRMERQFRQIVDELGKSEMFWTSLKKESIRYLSAYGFDRVPAAPKQVPIEMSDIIKIDSLFPYLFVRHPYERSTHFVACKGHVLELKDSQYVPELMQILNSGEGCEVRALVKSLASRRNAPEKLLASVQSLHQLGGLDSLVSELKNAA